MKKSLSKKTFVILAAHPLRRLNDEFPELLKDVEGYSFFVTDACWTEINSHPALTPQGFVAEIFTSWKHSKCEQIAPRTYKIDPFYYFSELSDNEDDGVVIFPALTFFEGTPESINQRIKDGRLVKEIEQRYDAMPDFWFPTEQAGFHEGGTVR